MCNVFISFISRLFLVYWLLHVTLCHCNAESCWVYTISLHNISSVFVLLVATDLRIFRSRNSIMIYFVSTKQFDEVRFSKFVPFISETCDLVMFANQLIPFNFLRLWQTLTSQKNNMPTKYRDIFHHTRITNKSMANAMLESSPHYPNKQKFHAPARVLSCQFLCGYLGTRFNKPFGKCPNKSVLEIMFYRLVPFGMF